jgi:hypothetical protein
MAKGKMTKGKMGKGEMAKIGGEMAKGELGKGEMGINPSRQVYLTLILTCQYATQFLKTKIMRMRAQVTWALARISNQMLDFSTILISGP